MEILKYQGMVIWGLGSEVVSNQEKFNTLVSNVVLVDMSPFAMKKKSYGTCASHDYMQPDHLRYDTRLHFSQYSFY